MKPRIDYGIRKKLRKSLGSRSNRRQNTKIADKNKRVTRPRVRLAKKVRDYIR